MRRFWRVGTQDSGKHRTYHGKISKKVDAELYHNLFAEDGGVLDMIEAKMPWLRGQRLYIQQDGARPHTADGTIDQLTSAGTGDGWTPLTTTQPPSSPDASTSDLGFFHSLKTDIREICTHCTSRTEMMANMLQAFEESPWDKLMASGPATSVTFAVSWRAMAGMTINKLIVVAQSASEIPDLPSTYRST